MQTYWNRQLRLIFYYPGRVPDVLNTYTEEYGIEFEIDKKQFGGNDPIASTCALKLHNPSQRTIDNCHLYQFISIEVGYGDRLSLRSVFMGEIKNVIPGRQLGRTWIQVYAHEASINGTKFSEFLPENIVSESVKMMPLAAMIKKIIPSLMKLDIDVIDAAQVISNAVYDGYPSQILYKLSKEFNFIYWTEGGFFFDTLYIRQAGSIAPQDILSLLTVGPEDGLLDFPRVELNHKTLSFRVFMCPTMALNTVIVFNPLTVAANFALTNSSAYAGYSQTDNAMTISSIIQSFTRLAAKGNIYITSIHHIGNTRGDDWYTEVGCNTKDYF